MSRVLLLWLALLAPLLAASSWPAADALFHQDPHWLGGDDAYSVDLGRGRVLWLFGDSFIQPDASGSRRTAVMVHNSVAIQQGYDPSSAAMHFYWNPDVSLVGVEHPQSFFANDNPAWYWPGDAVRLGPHLLVFLMRIVAVPDGLGFTSDGWRAVLVDNPDDDPPAWRLRWVSCPQNPWGVVVGSASVLQVGDYVYAYGSQEPAVHDVYLTRWPVAAATAGDLSTPQWWTGPRQGWCVQQALPERPLPVLRAAATEFTVHWDVRRQQFVHIQTVGFGPADLEERTAMALTGPWSPPTVLYRPPEAARPDAFIYAGKAHPELLGADLVLTYVDNTMGLAGVLRDQSIYYPRFVRVQDSAGGPP